MTPCQVSANSGDVGTHNGTANVVTGNAVIDVNGTYTVSGGAGTVAISVSGSATNVTIKLSSANASDNVTVNYAPAAQTATGASLTIDGGDAYNWNADNGWSTTKVTLANASSFGAITVKGDIELTDTAGELVSSGKIATAFGSLPVATTTDGGDTYEVGDKLIATRTAAKSDIFAVNGAVKATGLTSGKVAMLSTYSNNGTTISATAADKTSLVKVDTTYTYIFHNTKVNDYGTSTYEDVRYAAGKGGLTTLALTQPDGSDFIKTNYLSGGTAYNSVTAIKNYDRAITLTQSDDDKFEKGVHLTYADSTDYNGYTDANASGETGITYFTNDPSSYVADKEGVAKLDGAKYVINRTGTYYDTDDTKRETALSQLGQASKSAAKSIEIVKGTSETAQAADAYDVVYPNKGVTVSAPTSSSVVVGHVTYIGTKVNKTKNIGYIFGTNKVEGVNNNEKFFGESAELSNSVVSSAIEAPQIAAGLHHRAKISSPNSIGVQVYFRIIFA